MKPLALVLSVVLAVAALLGLGHRGSGRAAAASRTPLGTKISFVVGLRMNDAGLRRFVHAAANPSSPRYGRTLTPAQIGHRFGISLRAERHVTSILRRHHIEIVATYPQRTEVDARATVANLERYLHIGYRDHVTWSGVKYHQPTHSVTVPADLRPWVDGISGLSTKLRATPHTIRPIAIKDARRAYDVSPLYAAGVRGGGSAIAVLSFSDFTDGDVKLFDTQNHLPTAPPVRIPNPAKTASTDSVEADLDVEVIHGIAPAAKILFYTAGNSWSTLFNRFLQGPAKVASLSWGFCDKNWSLDAPDRRQFDKALDALAGAGKTLFVASGDHGAYDCQGDNFADHTLTVDWPSDSVDVVSVGGTLLGVRANGSYIGEDAWVEPLTNGGGGGGLSPVPRPAWQAGFVHNSRRGVPDVAAAASGGSRWEIVSGGGPDNVAGTSAASPFWAASMLLAEDYAGTQGVNAHCFLAPLLYGVYAMKQPYFPAFHDVQFGTNRHYAAKVGWDYATGLGSPDVWNLTRDLVAYLQANPGSCRSS